MSTRYLSGTAVSALFFTLLVSASCASPSTAIKTAGGKAFATRVTGAPIENYAVITPVLSRGAQPDDKGLNYLKARGCRTIVNFRSHHSEKKEAEALGFRVVEMPLHADILGSTPPTEEEVRRFFAVALDPSAQPVYFHCAHGKDRTGTMAALYRIEVDGWSNEEAVEEMLAFGYHTIYKDLIAYVRAYKPLGLCPPK